MTDDSEPAGDDDIAGLSRSDPLAAVSPLDGRYAARTTAAVAVCERSRAHARPDPRRGRVSDRTRSPRDATPIALDEEAEAAFRAVYEEFSAEDARLIKALEVEGAEGYAATNHDVKAVEYFLRVRLDGLDDSGTIADSEALYPWIHFGLTSEDVNNLAQRLLVKAGRERGDRARDSRGSGRARRPRAGAPRDAHAGAHPRSACDADDVRQGDGRVRFAARPRARRVVVANGDLSGKLAGASHLRRPRRGLPPRRLAGVRRVVRARGLIWNTRRSRRR